MNISERTHRWLWPLLLLLAGTILQWGNLSNPGYFSHDELQWGEFARVQNTAALPWVDPFDFSPLQYRPLTFNLWLLISYFLFESPQIYHCLWVVFGSCNALLLYFILRRIRLDHAVSFSGALGFLLLPYSMYVHGWVGTLGDLLWLAALLFIVLLVLGAKHDVSHRQRASRLLTVAWLTIMALLSKESAITIPCFCVVCACLSKQRNIWWQAALTSSIPVVVYLALRFPALNEGSVDSSYTWSASHVPKRWLEYQLYPYVPNLFEPGPIFNISLKRLMIAMGFFLLFYGAVLRANWRLGLGLLAGSAALLGPVLLLTFSAAQYGYGFGAVLAASGAIGFSRLKHKKNWQSALLAASILTAWHGMRVQHKMHEVGIRQAVFSTQLANLASAAEATPLYLWTDSKYSWAYQRLSHQIPGYQGIKHRRLILLTNDRMMASHIVEDDGSIVSQINVE